MKRCAFLRVCVLALVSLFFLMVPSSQAQTKAEKEFKDFHEKGRAPFMEKCVKCHSINVKLRDKTIKKAFLEKCSQCHSLERLFSKKRSTEEWDKILKIMAGKPHANINAE